MIDTNVALDYILQRSNFDDAKAVIDLAINDEEIECVTATTITDIHYEIAKYRETADSPKKYTSYDAQNLLAGFLNFVEILGVNDVIINKALQLRWKDFEDAVQYVTALENGVDCIITNNVKDYADSTIEVLTPKEFCQKYGPKGSH
ncbi:MAG: PIN domain-containing protein [Eubacterium sp.]|nr:PIN domain-containing protein [Eubacterium sp.]